MADLDVKLPVGRLIFGYAILIVLLALVTVATHVVPAGMYDRVERVNEETGATMEVIVPDSYTETDQNPQGVIDAVYSPIKSLYYKGPIGAILVVFIVFIGGSFMAMRRTGALDAGVLHFIRRFEGKEYLVIPIMMIFFSLFGSLFGIMEELVPFIIIVVPMAIAMGYDSIVGLMMIFGACAIGFTAAMTNPFTVGIAQGIAELPLFSGLLFRLFVWAVMISVAIAYTSWYARRVRLNPEKSLVKDFDADFREDFEAIEKEHAEFTQAHRRVVWVIGILVGILLLIIIGGQFLIPELIGDIGFPLVFLIFMIMGILAGLLGGLGGMGTLKAFGKGILTFLPASLLILLARSIYVVADEGLIMDTLLYSLSGFVGNFSTVAASWAMLLVQTAINFFIPSGSAQAMVSIPVMVPLGELLDITRQTSVLAFQMGDGFSNIFWPTNPMLIVAISLAGVSWTKWARFILPLQVILMAIGCGMLSIAVMIEWGPF